MTTRHIAAVTAGIGQPSSSRMLADRLSNATVGELEKRGIFATTQTVELRDIAHDIVNAVLVGFSGAELHATMREITGADALIAVSPLFATTYSGLFKSFVDIIDPEELTGMPVLLGATGGTPRHSLSLDYSMRPLFTYLHAEVVTTSVFAATDDWADDDSQGSPLPSRIDRAARELAIMMSSKKSRVANDEFAQTPSFDQLLKGTQTH